MAKLFRKDELEANICQICGTYGYVPPKYVRNGTYSMKYDVYSFGVLLLQIISGKRNTCYHGNYENLSLLEYAYILWSENKGTEFFDATMDDSVSSCKLNRCLYVGLFCVQENPESIPSSMLEIYSMIGNDTIELCNPKRPAYSIKVHEHLESRSFPLHEGCSVLDDELITQVFGR